MLSSAAVHLPLSFLHQYCCYICKVNWSRPPPSTVSFVLTVYFCLLSMWKDLFLILSSLTCLSSCLFVYLTQWVEWSHGPVTTAVHSTVCLDFQFYFYNEQVPCPNCTRFNSAQPCVKTGRSWQVFFTFSFTLTSLIFTGSYLFTQTSLCFSVVNLLTASVSTGQGPMGLPVSPAYQPNK